MNNRTTLSQSGLSLTEALITLALLCILIVPALKTLRQSAVNYSHAYSAYQTDLIVSGLIAEAKAAAETQNLMDISIEFTKYIENERYECVVIIDELLTGMSKTIRYPNNSVLAIQPASMTQTGYFSGLITVAAKDTVTGIIKIKAIPF